MLVGIAAVMVLGVIAENTLSIINPKGVIIKMDVEKIKKEINEAGLIPHEAVYWKEL